MIFPPNFFLLLFSLLATNPPGITNVKQQSLLHTTSYDTLAATHDDLAPGSGDFTVECWFKPTAVTANQLIYYASSGWVAGGLQDNTTYLPLAGGTMTGNINFVAGQPFPAGTTSAAGIVQLSDSTSTTSSALAATSTAVKSAYDRGSQLKDHLM